MFLTHIPAEDGCDCVEYFLSSARKGRYAVDTFGTRNNAACLSAMFGSECYALYNRDA